MGVAVVHSRAFLGVDAPLVSIEAHVSPGNSVFSMVGLPETAVKESKDRVRSAILNSHFDFPFGRITVNLAPADLPKEGGGGRFDLAMALSILIASGQLPELQLSDYEFAGELALTGHLRPVRGVLPFAIACADAGKRFILAPENAPEAALPDNSQVFAAKHLLDVCAHFTGQRPLMTYHSTGIESPAQQTLPDMRDVRGQAQARRALELAAAGRHSLLMSGPPGTGKTLLASRLTSILPPLTRKEVLDLAAVYSICGKAFTLHSLMQRPFRAPHHSASGAALVGGSNPPQPGEISLAHQGVLFLDELPEFSRHVLELLREPMELGHIVIARAARRAKFPANFQLIAAMNPCPCGQLTHPDIACRCSPQQIQRYKNRLSGPFLDRIDLHINLTPLPSQLLLQPTETAMEDSQSIRARVLRAHTFQQQRQGMSNSQLSHQQLKTVCVLGEAEQAFLLQILDKLKLSARVYHRLLKVSRTIADMAGCEHVGLSHLKEAVGYAERGRGV